MPPYLETLAECYVEQDGLSAEEQDKIIADASDYVRFGWKYHRDNPQSPATQLAMSIHRWASSMNDDANDGDSGMASDLGSIEKAARAHNFISRILNTLPKATLQVREVKLFLNFFKSMYQLQGASIPAATEALISLVWMDNFDVSLSGDLLFTIGSMEPENYTKQLAKTRSEILQLLKLLLTGECGTYLQERYPGSGHLLRVLDLAGKERDPSNLLRWFRDLNTILKRSVLSTEVADAAFASFSPFFPISIRRSTATGPEVTEQQLKDALNSCFSSNGRLAHRTIPFLVEKLNGGASLTAAAKLDILRTIKACVEGYDPIETYVLPYLPQIWSSLKYEVRNGDVPEAIQETLSVFEMSTKRLALQGASVHLKDFVDTIWNDCAEDFENPTYTEQLGSILISVARAHHEPFKQISPRIIDAISHGIAQPKSAAHTKTLLLILNNLLRARRQLMTPPSTRLEKQEDLLTIARDIYLTKLKENAVDDPSREQVEVAKEALEGLTQIVQQPCPIQTAGENDDTTSWTKDMLQEICSTLAFRYMNDFGIRPAAPSDAYRAIEAAAGLALRMTVRFYPGGYGNIVSDLLNETSKRSWTGTPPERSFQALQNSCIKAAFLGCTITPDIRSAGVVNFSIFAGSMLKLLGVLSTSRASFKASFWVIRALFEGILSFIRTPEVQQEILGNPLQWEAAWSLASVENAVKDILPSFPNLVSGQFFQFDPSLVVQLLAQAPKSPDAAFVASVLQISVYIVAQLYQSATEEKEDGNQGVRLYLSEHLSLAASRIELQMGSLESEELWRNRYLETVGKIGHVVLVDLGLPAQQALNMGQQIVRCFHPLRSGHEGRLSWEYHADGVIATLSRGVACAARREIVSRLGNDIHDLLVGDFGSVLKIPSQTLFARDQIAYELANKYDPQFLKSSLQRDKAPEAWARVLVEIQNNLCDASDMASMALDKFSRIVYVLTGALRRGDRFIRQDLYVAISRAAVNGGPRCGKYMARILGLLFLAPEEPPAGLHNHATFKSLFQQRLYYQSIRPILQLAYPLSPEGTDSVTYAIYVLHAVKNLTLKQYEENRTEILRIALAAMQKAEDPSDINCACTVVLQLYNTSIRDHLSSIISACVRVYCKGLDVNPTSNVAGNPWKQEPLKDFKPPFMYQVEPVEIRKKSIQLLRLLPAKLEEMVLRPHANVVLMHLATVYADKSRGVRQLAQVARNEWIKVSE